VDSPTAHELLALISINCYVGGFLDLNAGSDDVRRPLAFRCLPADDPLPWTMVAIGMHSVVQLLFEPSDGEPGEAVPSVPDRPAPPVLDVGDPNRRRTRAELRDLVVAAGVEVLLQQRVDLRPETLSYASVLEHVERTRGVTLYRSSVHGRIWDSHKEYWLDVLARAIDAEPVIDRSIVADLAADAPPGAGDGPDGRWQRAMAEVRMLAAADTAARLASTDFLRRQSIRSALLMEPDSEPFSSLRRLLHRSQTTEIARLKDFYRQVVSLGFEVRPELGIDDEEALRILATLYLSAASGAVFDQAAGVESSSRTYTLRPAGEHGRHRQWPAISVATWAVFAYLFQVADP
jgi:hypothetical protein